MYAREWRSDLIQRADGIKNNNRRLVLRDGQRQRGPKRRGVAEVRLQVSCYKHYLVRLVFFAKKSINDQLGLDNLELFIIEMQVVLFLYSKICYALDRNYLQKLSYKDVFSSNQMIIINFWLILNLISYVMKVSKKFAPIGQFQYRIMMYVAKRSKYKRIENQG